MSETQESAEQREERVVAFPELVRLRFQWRKAVREAATDESERSTKYHTALTEFIGEHGRIVNAYWCAELEAGVALTEKSRVRGPFKRLRAPLRHYHRVSDYATRNQPGIARLMHECDELAVRAIEVLSGRNQRICMQLVMASSGHLLSLIDRPVPTKTEVSEAIAVEERDFLGAQAYYRQAANGEAQMVYFGGMAVGLGLLAGLYLLIGEQLDIAGVNEANIVGCLTAGAIGALVSVIARINSGSFALDFDVRPGYTLFLGSLRPWIGSIFGLVIYFAITSGFLNLFDVPADPEQRFYFLCVVSFLAGFSERWAQDTLTGGLGDQAPTATGPPIAAAEHPTATPTVESPPHAK